MTSNQGPKAKNNQQTRRNKKAAIDWQYVSKYARDFPDYFARDILKQSSTDIGVTRSKGTIGFTKASTEINLDAKEANEIAGESPPIPPQTISNGITMDTYHTQYRDYLMYLSNNLRAIMKLAIEFRQSWQTVEPQDAVKDLFASFILKEVADARHIRDTDNINIVIHACFCHHAFIEDDDYFQLFLGNFYSLFPRTSPWFDPTLQSGETIIENLKRRGFVNPKTEDDGNDSTQITEIASVMAFYFYFLFASNERIKKLLIPWIRSLIYRTQVVENGHIIEAFLKIGGHKLESFFSDDLEIIKKEIELKVIPALSSPANPRFVQAKANRIKSLLHSDLSSFEIKISDG